MLSKVRHFYRHVHHHHHLCQVFVAEAGQRDQARAVTPMGLLSIAPLKPLPQNWTFFPPPGHSSILLAELSVIIPTRAKLFQCAPPASKWLAPNRSHHVTLLMTSWAAMVVLSKSAMVWEPCQQLVLGLHAQHLNHSIHGPS